MVYESDFYTTRRPYSRPLVSSYSVTDRPITLPLSSILQLRTIPHMPYVAHKRLVTIVHTPIHTVYHAGALIPVRIHARVRPSVLAAELYRIRNLPRPSSVSYLEKYLNSRDHIYFDDEAKEIRARVDSLMRRVHVFVPRAVSSDFAEEIVPERMRSGDYVRRLISGKSNAKKDVDAVPWYEIPERGNFSNLACVKYVAGKPQSVRKPYYKVADLHASDIRNDVNFLSYYSKNRQAAATASPAQPMTERELRKARALEPDSNAPVQRKALKVEKEPEVKQEKKRELRREAEQTTKAECVSTPAKQPEPVKQPEPEPEPVKELESIVEPEKELEQVPEPVKEPEPVPKPVKEPEPVAKRVSKPVKKSERAPEPTKKPEPVKEPEPVPEPAKEPEPVPEPAKEPEPVPEPVKEPEPVSEPIKEPEEVKVESEQAKEEKLSEPEVTSKSEPNEKTEAASKTEEAKEEKQGDNDVKQDKLSAMQRVEKYLVKTAEEARTAEQRTEAYEQQKVQLELDEIKAWEALQIATERTAQLEEILEMEKAEEERQAEDAKIEAAHEEVQRIEEVEREMAEAHVAALLEEQQRMVVEENLDNIARKADQEERLADVTFDEVEEAKEMDLSREDQLTSDYMDQEREEEKPFELMTDDDARVEEENVVEDERLETPEVPFVEEPDAGESKPESGPNAIDESPKFEEVTSGGEESFEWGDEDA